MSNNKIAAILDKHEAALTAEWLIELKKGGLGRDSRMSEAELTAQAKEFVTLLRSASQGNTSDLLAPQWKPMRDFLERISRTRAQQGFSSDETAMLVFSFKKPLFERMREEFSRDAELFANESWGATKLLDELGLFTVRTFQRTREDIISRQQEEMLELSTPVVKLWDGILALPMIGTLDSARTQIVMESLLQRIVDTSSEIAIIDITGVPVVDTMVAQHLLKAVAAIRLMGAECIISGVRPQIAQTIVHLGVDLQGITTKSNLSDALLLALKRTGYSITKSSGAQGK